MTAEMTNEGELPKPTYPEGLDFAAYDLPTQRFDEGITFAIEQLAYILGVTDWTQQDGSEIHDQDVRDTISNVLARRPSTPATAGTDEPVAWRWRYVDDDISLGWRGVVLDPLEDGPNKINKRVQEPLYVHPVPVPSYAEGREESVKRRLLELHKKLLAAKREHIFVAQGGDLAALTTLALDAAIAIERALPAPAGGETGPTHRHKKRGTEYVLIGFGKMQAEHWYQAYEWQIGDGHDYKSVDMREVAIYRSVDDGSLWVRPREEFEDGRFEALPTPPSTEAPK